MANEVVMGPRFGKMGHSMKVSGARGKPMAEAG